MVSGQTGSRFVGSWAFGVVRSRMAIILPKSSARVGAGNNTDTSSAERGAIACEDALPWETALAGPFGGEPPHALKKTKTPTTQSLKPGEENPVNRCMKVSQSNNGRAVWSRSYACVLFGG